MISKNIKNHIERVRRMEEIFDILTAGIQTEPPFIDENLLTTLVEYYDNGEWMHDYELDEAGLFPSDLKRGVLSEDGVYNLLSLVSELFKNK